MARETKHELEQRIASLERSLKAVRNELSEFSDRWNRDIEWIPCGKVVDVSGHPFEDEIRNAVCEGYDGSTGWIRIELDLDRVPFQFILANVSYSREDGTYVDKFCRLARVDHSKAKAD